ncbi:MAG: hypothetical protein R3B13_13100 [Polyangiaceae bacterium]
MTTLTVDGRTLALELYDLLRGLDKGGWSGRIDDARTRLEAIQAHATAISGEQSSSSERWQDIVEGIRESLPEAGSGREAWQSFRARMIPAYEALAAALRAEAEPVPSLRPKNLRRSLFHVTSGSIVLILVEEILPLWGLIVAPAIFAGTFWFLEILRRFSARANDGLMWFFRHVAHPHERHRVNSSTWYATALLLISFIQLPMVCAVAVAVLGIADPAAGLVGRRWGKVSLIHGRTLEGTLTFFLTGTLAALAVLSIWHAQVGWSARLGVAAAAAGVGALVELFSHRMDDNFSVPVSAALAAWGTTAGFGLL